MQSVQQSVEYYEEVDERDGPTGRLVTREEAHGQKLVHRCIAIYVFDNDGNLFVQEHKKSGNLLDHSVGGHVDQGEDYDTAACREMDEEIGLRGVNLKKIASSFYADEGDYIHMYGIYTCVAPDDWSFVPNDEVAVLRRMKVADVVAEMDAHGHSKFTGGMLRTIKKYLEITKNGQAS